MGYQEVKKVPRYIYFYYRQTFFNLLVAHV